MYARILVPVDGSETSSLGLDEAIKIAKVDGSRLRLVHVVNEYIFDYTYSPTAFASNLIDVLQESGKKILAEAEHCVRRQGVSCDSVMLESIGGSAAALIIEQASLWPADLIVMGTHGRRGLVRLTLGSDAEQVVRASTVPVLLVRGAPKVRQSAHAQQPAGTRAA
jgi:nucleotide-binding universal stress UspA family protein